VNNFATVRNFVVNSLPSEENDDGCRASGPARFRLSYPKRIRKRTPAGSKASAQRSERTPSHEDFCISSTGRAAALERNYYPAALEAFDDWTMPAAWAFVESFPTPQDLVKAGKRRWEKFLHTHRLYRPETYAKRLEIFERAAEFAVREEITRAKSRLVLARARMLCTLQSQIEAYRSEIEKLFSKHPDSNLFGSLPGVGEKLGPRLLGEIGSDRSLYSDPKSLQCVAGTAPVSYQSGQIYRVYLRRHCNKLLRNSIHLWADLSRPSCPWAAAYYGEQRRRGKSHACALRALGQRWLKILWKMLQTNRPYDPNLHAKSQLEHGSWVLKLLRT